MDGNTHRMNERNINFGGDTKRPHAAKRPTIRRSALELIHLHLKPNSPKKESSNYIENEKNCEDMKILKKPDAPVPKVSDSFPKTSPVIKRNSKRDVLNRGLFHVKDISLPDEKTSLRDVKKSPDTKDPPVKSEADELIEDKKCTFPGRVIVQNDLQISITTDNSYYIPSDQYKSVSSLSSCESSEHSFEKSKADYESPDDRIAWNVRQSLYESSPVKVTTSESNHNSNFSEYVGRSTSSYNSEDCASERTAYSSVSSNHSYPVMQSGYYASRDYPCMTENKSVYTDEKPTQIINFPPDTRVPPPPINVSQFQTPPPTVNLPYSSTPPATEMWRTPVSYRDHPPGKERHSRSVVREKPWAFNSRSRSWNRSSGSEDQKRNMTKASNWRQSQESIEQEYSHKMTSANFSSPANWRQSQESTEQEYSHKMTSANFNSPANWRNSQDLSLEESRSDRRTVILQGTNCRKSYEAISIKPKIETITRASSLESVSIRSAEIEHSINPPYLYHLSPDEAYQQALWQKSSRDDYSLGRGQENHNFSSPIPPYWAPSLIHPWPLSYLPRQEADDPLEPHFRGHQLLGDSQLLRFSRQILGKNHRSIDNMRFLGLCVSGQTIQELLHKIKAKFYPVGEKIILLIGTNNFLQNHCVDDMIQAWGELVSHLLSVPNRRMLLMTLPPIPRLAAYESHWEKLTQFNTFIKGFGGGSKDDVKVVDICKLFLSEPKQCREELFELMYTETKRTDLVHFNNRGLTLIRDYLIQNDML